MVDPPSEELPIIEDMNDAMIAIYLEQARQEQTEDDEFREWERVWTERYNEEYERAILDL